jgi:hypothetical protein
MHRGKIVFEQYFGHCVPHTRHIINSATKVVIARFGSAKTASSRTLEHLISPIHDAIVAAL